MEMLPLQLFPGSQGRTGPTAYLAMYIQEDDSRLPGVAGLQLPLTNMANGDGLWEQSQTLPGRLQLLTSCYN